MKAGKVDLQRKRSVEAGKDETGSDTERNVGQGNREGTW